MQFRLLRLRFRRRLRKGQQQVEDLGQQAEQQIEQHFFGRFARLSRVKRFVFGWVGLMVLVVIGLAVQNFMLSGYYQTLRPVAGGIYHEGILGTFTNANPMYATSDVDTTVSHLLFASLFTYDEHNKLVGDLASGYDVDTKGTTYTVHLKPNLKWHDGETLDSSDVLFTYTSIQNPDAQSPLRSGWQGIVVAAPDNLTVTFKLPGPLAAFPYSMTNGIVPQHLLAKVPAAELRSADFNTVHPVGSGPFSWQAIQVSGGDPSRVQEQIALVPFAQYQAGKPKLDEFVVHAYAAESELVKAFRTNQLNGAEGINSVSDDVKRASALQVHSMLMTAETMVFFKTSQGVLSESGVRGALVQSTDVSQIIDQLGYATRAVREPLLIGQLGYDPTYKQAGFDIAKAKALLDGSGWAMGANGIRVKGNQKLAFTLTSADTPEYRMVMKNLQRDWRAIGVEVRPQFLTIADFQSSVSEHQYDAVLYGISIGVDPDVYAYWDSSQADIRSASRLNLSEWKNATADAALEAGRTRRNPELRVIKYKPFLQAWQSDNPALGLYQPRLLYLTDGSVSGLTDHIVNTSADRLNNVQNWEIRQAKVTN